MRPLSAPIFLLAGVLAFVPAVHAQGGPAIEPEAVQALQRMGQTLKALRTFSVKGAASSEEVLPQGLKVRRDKVSTLEVARPDHVRAEQTAAGWHRQVVYDGKTVSILSKSAGYYAQAPATASVAEPLGLAGCASAPADPAARRRETDTRVDAAMAQLASSPDLRQLAGRAQAVLVFPEVISGGLIVGASHGEGALRVQGRTAGYY